MEPLPPSSAHVGGCLAGRYDLVRHIARGGMADVYEGQDRVLARRVAVKVFRSASPADRDRFDAEIRLLAGLDHPTLVRIYDAGACHDDAYLVMELVDGPTLATRLAEHGPIAPREAASIGADLADALASIHAQGVVHRDVTPANVLCGSDGRVRLVDFGIARLLGTPRVTSTAMTVGTATYMAPEQVTGGEVTGATDVYSLGLVLLELLTGRKAFDGPRAEVAVARLAREPDTETDVPAAWRPILGAMTSRDPSLRLSAATTADRLRTLAAAEVDDATAAVPVAPPPERPIAGSTPPAGPPLGAPHALTAPLAVGGATAIQPRPPIPATASAAVGSRSEADRRAWTVAMVAVAAVALGLVAWAGLGGHGGLPTSPTTIPPADVDAASDPGSDGATVASTVTTAVVETTTVPVTETTAFDPFGDGPRPPGQEKKGKGAKG